jgi:DNA-binding HxlR family transcriptional regulator
MNEHWRDSRSFVQLVSGRWTLTLLTGLSESGRRYQELHDTVDGISYKVPPPNGRG